MKRTWTPERTAAVGEAARISGLTVRAIRFYEEHGLIRADRNRRHQRRYSDETIEQLRTIARARQAGLSIKDIGAVFALEQEDGAGAGAAGTLLAQLCRERQKALQAELNIVEQMLQELRAAPIDLGWRRRAQGAGLTLQRPLAARA